MLRLFLAVFFAEQRFHETLVYSVQFLIRIQRGEQLLAIFFNDLQNHQAGVFLGCLFRFILGLSREERLMDALFHLNRSGIPAPETGYYFLETGNQDGTDTAVWLQSAINPLDSVYAVINPEEQV